MGVCNEKEDISVTEVMKANATLAKKKKELELREW